MKYYTFYREDNNFSEILKDTSIKGFIKTKIKWSNYLMLGFTENDDNDNIFGYIVLKYGDNIKDPIVRDYTPTPYIDYIPKRD